MRVRVPMTTPQIKSLSLDGKTKLDVKVAPHARATKLKLTLDHRTRQARLTLPPGMSQAEGWKFVEANKQWLAQRFAQLSAMPAIAPGQTIPFGVGTLKLELAADSTRITRTRLEGDRLIVGGEPEFFARRVADFFKDYTRKDLSPRVILKAHQLGKSVKRIAIRDQKTRWGSCTSSGTLSFSWRIGLTPDYIRDYLAAHEVAHLKEMNHGPNFWRTCDTLCVQGKAQRIQAEAWLKRHGGAIMGLAME